MKKLVLAGLALAALGDAASAADRPVKAPYQPPAPPPVYGWTGFYIGVNAGGGWDRRDVVESLTSSFCNTTLGGCGTGAFSAAANSALPPAFPVRSSGFIGGGQLGYNYQTGAVVWGVEADFQGANIHGSNVQSLTAVPPGFGGIGNTVTIAGVADKKLDFLGTVRGRVGVAFDPLLPVLLYATGGFAYGHVSSNTTLTEVVGGPCFCGLPAAATGSISTTRTGWSAGAGGEWAFSPALSVRVEWLHYDLGTPSYGLTPLTQLNGAGVPFFGISTVSSTTFRGDIVRAGLNWKFGGGYGGPSGYGGPGYPAY